MVSIGFIVLWALGMYFMVGLIIIILFLINIAEKEISEVDR